jgi:hypothetical protein
MASNDPLNGLKCYTPAQIDDMADGHALRVEQTPLVPIPAMRKAVVEWLRKESDDDLKPTAAQVHISLLADKLEAADE